MKNYLKPLIHFSLAGLKFKKYNVIQTDKNHFIKICHSLSPIPIKQIKKFIRHCNIQIRKKWCPENSLLVNSPPVNFHLGQGQSLGQGQVRENLIVGDSPGGTDQAEFHVETRVFIKYFVHDCRSVFFLWQEN